MKRNKFSTTSECESMLCNSGLTEHEARAIIGQGRKLRSFDTIEFFTEFLMFFVSWAEQGRKHLFQNVITFWKKLWGSWCQEAKLLRTKPLSSPPTHQILIERMYARFGVTFNPLGI